MGMGDTITAWALLAFVVALVTVRACIAYALRRGLLDLPGQRRSHVIPTARGGGVGIVVGFVASMLPAACVLGTSPTLPWMLALCTLAVAAIGWLDDHGSLPVRPRLLVQLAASALFAVALIITGASWWWLLPLTIAGTWSINLHNFIDGIDGLLAQQCMFVGVGLAMLAVTGGLPVVAIAATCFAAASLGFCLFNRSPARIFMGDVGSGAVGFIVFALTGWLWQAHTDFLWPALLLSSAVTVDATLTLLLRMARGKRWTTPHREHLYQWLVRRGLPHARVTNLYTVWNLLVTAPLAWCAWRWPGAGMPVCLLGYVASAVVWWFGKRLALPRRRHLNAVRPA